MDFRDCRLGFLADQSISDICGLGISSGPYPENGSKSASTELVCSGSRLGWSHYVTLLSVTDPDARRFYEIEAADNGWSVRELKRQLDSSLYQRLALSRDKHEVRRLARDGQVVEKASDLIKDPVVLEFLGLGEKPAYSESDLESAIIDRLQQFLLELGKGFLFEARQKRFSFDDSHFFVDLVFYNRLLRCYVLIDLQDREADPPGSRPDADVRELLRSVREDRRRTADRRNPPVRPKERRCGRADAPRRRQHLRVEVPALSAVETASWPINSSWVRREVEGRKGFLERADALAATTSGTKQMDSTILIREDRDR